MTAVQDLLAPIDEERPGGVEVTYEIDYSRIEGIRRNIRHPPNEKLDQIDPREGYEDIVELAEKILSEESKDLTLGIWLAEARLALEGFGGLADGLELVRGLMEGFWDHLFPEHLEDRAYALEFLGEGFVTRGEKYDPMLHVALTDRGHNLHHFDEWRGIRKDAFAGEDPKAKKAKDQDAEDGAALSADTVERAVTETPKTFFKALVADVARCEAEVAALEKVVKERFEGAEVPKPSFGRLKEALGRGRSAAATLLAKKLETDPDPAGEPAAAAAAEPPSDADAGDGAAEPTGEAAPARARTSAPVGLTPEPQDADDAVRRIAAAARFLRRADATNPAPYLLLRALRWGELRKGGGALDVRLLDAPPTELRKRLKSLLLGSDWAALVEAGEEVMASPSGRGWLDLQRYVVTALEGLGGTYRPVVDAVRHEIAALLRDVPDLTSRTLMDDTPTANVETLEWLALQGLMPGGRDGEASVAGAPAPPDYDRERVLSEATHEKALEWVAAGNPGRGVELLMKRAEREESARARFITESLAASILVDAGMVSVARPMLEDLVDLVTKKTLDQWEAAEVVARPIGLLYRCLPANDRRRSQLYDQICRLDPMLAISLESQQRAASSGRGAQEPSDAPTQSAESAPPLDPGSSGS